MSSPRRFVRQPGGIRASSITPGCAHAGPCGGSPGPFPDSITAAFGSAFAAGCADCSGLGTVTLTHDPLDCLSYTGTVSNGCDTYQVLLSYTTTATNPAQHWVLTIQAPSPATCGSGGFQTWEQTDTAFSGTIGLVNNGFGTDACCSWPTTIDINVPDCITGAGKSCCCGGPPSWPRPCYHACLSGCIASAGELELCFNKATGRYETSNTSGVVGRLTNSGGAFTLEWSCDNFASSGSHTFSGAEITWAGDSPVYSATVPDSSGCCADGTPVIIQIGRFTHCAGTCATSCFLNALAADWDVVIGASLTNLVWDSCAAVGATFTVVQGGGIEPGSLCNWGFVEALGDIAEGQTCGACGRGGCGLGWISASGLRISVGLYAVTGGCQFVLTLIFGSEADDTSGTGTKTSCKGSGTYYSDVYPLGSTAPTSVRFTGGGTATPACNGALPGTIDMFAA